ncbi:transposase [Alkaliphilus serpentinus]|uniref:Transposase n=1 Tax=Alkaliphilus serpentinus TaxID=1482731 RepID=A0A833HNL7_9FIRM|nr:transposase [Alkaliphilus serpentinus]KAB3529692.1 transposase [Alkaliphilus serpentinus]
MPRYARQRSSTGIYHVMVRGNERKSIFIDDDNKERIIDTLREKKRKNEFELYGYCIMDNHAHFLIKEETDTIDRIMKRIGISYAKYYNQKHRRIGHVFQDRFKSEEVEDENYLLAVLRYIHNNPEKAHICKRENYKWSSYNIYINGILDRELLSTHTILSILSNNQSEAIRLFKEYSQQASDVEFIDEDDIKDEFIDEKKIRDFVFNYLYINEISFSKLKEFENRGQRDKLIIALKDEFNLSTRKIGEAIGINRETIRKVLESFR